MPKCDYSTNMAACTRTGVGMALKGAHLFSGRWLLTQGCQTPAVCHSVRLHVSPAASLCSSRTDPQRSSQTHSSAGAQTDDRRDEEEVLEGPEYTPRKKAKNPMIKIGYAWMIGLPTGIIGFVLAKRQVDKNRLKQLKIRQRMKISNEGEYDRSRYRHQTENVKLDQ